MSVVLTGDDLTIEDVVRVARAGERVELAPEAFERMAESRAVVERVLRSDELVYGLTTGVGMRKKVRIDVADLDDFNHMLVLNHRVGQGPPAPEEVVRGMMLRIANGFAKGTAGVRPALAERVVAALNDRAFPYVRMLGSVGQADLAPNADLAESLMAEFRLAAKEGIALLNSNAFSTAWAALAVADYERLLDTIDVAGALDLEALAGNLSILHPAVGETRPFPGLKGSLARFRTLLEGSYLWDEGAARNLQDPLTFRCLPQVHGAARDALDFARRQLEIELNASQENPLVVPEGIIVSVANFDVLPLAAALDFLRIALAPVLTSAAERGIKLLQAAQTGLAEGLSVAPGLAEDSLSEFGVPIQGLTAEARLLAQPVSFEVVSATHAEGIEDRATMAPLAARRLAEMVGLGERVVAIELVLAAQAVDLRGPPPLGAGTRRAYELVREHVAFMDRSDAVPQDLEPLVELIRAGAFR